MSEKFEHLFKPIKIGPIEIKNRFAMSPMNMMMTVNGYMTEQEAAVYAARAKGGYGLIIVGCFMGAQMAADFPANINLHLLNPTHVPPLIEMTDTIHFFGAKVFAQITPGFGRQGHSWIGLQPYSASSVPIDMELVVREKERLQAPSTIKKTPAFDAWLKSFTKIPREMTVEEIKRTEREFVRSAWLAMCAGFDGVEIHAPHGYLLHQFRSPLVNKRKDEYGGTFENRIRFLTELAEMTKDMCGDFPVGVRLSVEEHLAGGITVEDTKETVKVLEKLGVDYINLSDGGGRGDSPIGGVEFVKHILDHAIEIKKVLKIPVIVPSQTDYVMAEEAIKEGKIDIISHGRQSIADPETPNKVKDGKLDKITKCTKCGYCAYRSYVFRTPVVCPINPNFGREKYMAEYQRPPRPKGVSVLTWGQEHLPPEPPPP